MFSFFGRKQRVQTFGILWSKTIPIQNEKLNVLSKLEHRMPFVGFVRKQVGMLRTLRTAESPHAQHVLPTFQNPQLHEVPLHCCVEKYTICKSEMTLWPMRILGHALSAILVAYHSWFSGGIRKKQLLFESCVVLLRGHCCYSGRLHCSVIL